MFNSINLKFIHIPKTGGTSIEMAAKNYGILYGQFDTTLKSFNNCNSWHCPQKTETYRFCVIRNPYERLISQFYHENEVIDYNSDKLNKFIKTKMNIIKKNIHESDNHFLQQYKYYEMCDIAISFENLEHNYNNLMKIFNLPSMKLLKLPGGNKQQEKRKNYKLIRFKYHDINKDNIKLIDDFYNKDIKLYNEVKEKGIIFK